MLQPGRSEVHDEQRRSEFHRQHPTALRSRAGTNHLRRLCRRHRAARADPPQFYNVPFSCHQIDPIKELLIAADFSDIGIAVVGLEKPIPDMPLFARGLVYGNPLIDQIRTRGGVEPELIVDALLQALRHEFGVDPGRMPLQAIVFSATKR
jgi:hypothetical protein